jgi:hypothetical protein
MSDTKQKTYVPASSAKLIPTSNGGILKISFRAKELVDFAKANANDRGYINLCVTQRREVGKYGETHAVWLDTWKPEPKADSGQHAPTPEQRKIHQEDVPF